MILQRKLQDFADQIVGKTFKEAGVTVTMHEDPVDKSTWTSIDIYEILKKQLDVPDPENWKLEYTLKEEPEWENPREDHVIAKLEINGVFHRLSDEEAKLLRFSNGKVYKQVLS
jgi:hypothetical protein